MSDGAQWYVVHTYSGYENTVKATIEKYVENRGLQDLIHEISIPLETVTEITDNGPKEVERKVFPGYVLVKMVMTDECWHIVRNIRGVTGFLGSGNKPIPLSESDIAALGVEKREIVVGYEVGDSVKITDGALESFLGTVEEIDLDRSKVRVVVSMFGRETPVELELDQVEPVQACPIETQSCRVQTRPVGGTERSVPPVGPAGHGLSWSISNHIFHMEVLFRGTESNWIRKTSDPRRQGDAGPPCWPRSGPAWCEHRRFHQGIQ